MMRILKERYEWLLLNEAVLLDGLVYKEWEDEESLHEHVGMLIRNCFILVLLAEEIRRIQ